jgi:hypothetical protein
MRGKRISGSEKADYLKAAGGIDIGRLASAYF